MHPRVLIVGTVPYNKQSTSRAFDAYFRNWEKENLAQIFSNTKKPCKGHCGTLFQITDQRMLKRRFNRNIETGEIFNYDELETAWTDNDLEVGSRLYSGLYRIGTNKTSLLRLARKAIWKKKYWNTDKLNKWLDDFDPECVFLSFSDDFFILEIALYVAEKYDIPIVSSTGDDYYFNDSFSLSPFYHIYRSKYKALNRKVFAHRGSAIYIGDKIRDKYNSEFGLNGETIYLASEIDRGPFKPIDRDSPKITYCGNIRLGRDRSLIAVARALKKYNGSYKLTVYSNENDPAYIKRMERESGIDFLGSVPYSKVKNEIETSDVVVIVEGFSEKDVRTVRYSVSTKVADSVASGRFILTYGSGECGAVEQMKRLDCGAVCESPEELDRMIPVIFEDTAYQKRCYDNSEAAHNKYYLPEDNASRFERIVKKAIDEYDNGQ
ncbi:MAG: hypothetical protein IJT91_06135 [Clostridia bacterium]|nr:hypothetical protein [Clostridia bacterium]